MKADPEKKLNVIRALLDRYRRLPRHAHPQWRERLDALRAVQVASLQGVHEASCERSDYRTLLAYYAEYLHSGVNLDRIVSEGEGVLRIASHLEETYELLVNALEFSVRAQELDDALVGADADTAPAGSGQAQARIDHAQLLRPLGPGLAPYARSLLARGAFKIAMTPLRATGLAPLVVTLDKGFDVLRKLEGVERSFDELIANNVRAIETLYR